MVFPAELSEQLYVLSTLISRQDISTEMCEQYQNSSDWTEAVQCVSL